MAWRRFLAVLVSASLCGPAWADLVSDAQVMIRAKDFAGAATVLNSGTLTPEGMLLLASLYRSGKGVARDEAKARALTETAAQAGLDEAQYAMARMEMDGIGKAADLAAARLWAEAAAMQGHAKAAELLVTLAMTPEAVAVASPPVKTQPAPPTASALSQTLGQTPLMEAAGLGRDAMVKALLAGGASLNDRDPEGRTALMFAAESGSVVVVAQLLAAGADLALRDTRGSAALDLAAAAGKTEVAAALVDAGADPMQAHPGIRRTPLEQALLAAQCPAAAAIVPIPAPGDVNLARIAAQNCDGELLVSVIGTETLLADPDQTDFQGRTLVWLAASSANASALTTLLQSGGDPERPDNRAIAPIKAAALATGGAEAVAALIAAGAAVDGGADTPDGNSALILAAGRAEAETVHALIGAGANLDHANALGETAMMAAARAGSLAVIADLLQAGADPSLRNFRREMAVDIARNSGHVDLLALFP